MGTKNKPNELYINRIYDAPVKLVWDAWTDPQKAAMWWGPRGFTITTHSKDLRVGGSWVYTMHGPDGVDYPNKTIYHEVEEYAKLVYDHGGNDDRPPLFRVTVLFTEVAGKTLMEMTMALESPEAAREIKKFIKLASGNSTWDRLGEYLEEKQNSKDVFVFNQVIEAPINRIVVMWTKPEQILKWLDKVHHVEMQKPNLLVYAEQFSGQEKALIHQVTLISENSEGPELTRVTVCSELVDHAAPELRAQFHQSKTQMTQNWSRFLDKLEEKLLLKQ